MQQLLQIVTRLCAGAQVAALTTDMFKLVAHGCLVSQGLRTSEDCDEGIFLIMVCVCASAVIPAASTLSMQRQGRIRPGLLMEAIFAAREWSHSLGKTARTMPQRAVHYLSNIFVKLTFVNQLDLMSEPISEEPSSNLQVFFVQFAEGRVSSDVSCYRAQLRP